MASLKRRPSLGNRDGDDTRNAKMARGLHEDDGDGKSPPPEPRASEEIKIVVKLRSISKAARNDPKRPEDEKENNHSLMLKAGGDALGSGSTPSHQSPPAASIQIEPPTADGQQGSASSRDSTVDAAMPMEVDMATDDNDHDHEETYDGYPGNHDDGITEISDCPSSMDYFAGFQWMEQIDGQATVAGIQIADCDAKLIRRDQVRRDFWSNMEEPSQETSKLAFGLFDRYGRLQRQYFQHQVRKGTGVWGEELDLGDILLFEKISVKPEWRRQNIATRIVQDTLKMARAKSTHFFALVQPGYLTRELPEFETKEEERKAIFDIVGTAERFFRSLGFRSIGSSGWLGFTDDTTHPSRQISAAEDWEDPRDAGSLGPPAEALREAWDALLNPDASSTECVEHLRDALDRPDATLSCRSTDKDCNTILHIAAQGRKAEAIAHLLSACPALADMRNIDGYTPVEALQASLEMARTRLERGFLTIAMSDKFKDFSHEDIDCLAALTNTVILNLSQVSEQELSAIWSSTISRHSVASRRDVIHATLRMKYGCTCGACICGILSPRMRFATLCVAEDYHEQLGFDLEETDIPGPAWVKYHKPYLSYLPDSVRQNLATNKSSRMGFINMFDHIAGCLREERLPTEENVLDFYRNRSSEWPPVMKHYLQRGGTVAAVASMVFEGAMEWDEWAGDGFHRMAFGEKIDELPPCRNDHEFGFVSGMCGYQLGLDDPPTTTALESCVGM